MLIHPKPHIIATAALAPTEVSRVDITVRMLQLVFTDDLKVKTSANYKALYLLFLRDVSTLIDYVIYYAILELCILIPHTEDCKG